MTSLITPQFLLSSRSCFERRSSVFVSYRTLSIPHLSFQKEKLMPHRDWRKMPRKKATHRELQLSGPVCKVVTVHSCVLESCRGRFALCRSSFGWELVKVETSNGDVDPQASELLSEEEAMNHVG